jgi:hypothetical protein
MPADGLDQGREQKGHPADPVGHHRAIDLDPGPGIDVALPMQRQMIAVLRHQHMGEQGRAWTAPFDRQRRHRRLHDRLASATAQLRPDVHHPFEERRHVFQHLALILADPAEHRPAAARAGTGRGMHHVLARQMIGQRLACAGRPPAPCRRQGRIDGRLGPRLGLGLAFLDLADLQLELFDAAVELLGGPAEPRPAQHRQLHLQLLDMQRLGVNLCSRCRERQFLLTQSRLEHRREGAQLVGIGGERGHRQRHAPA